MKTGRLISRRGFLGASSAASAALGWSGSRSGADIVGPESAWRYEVEQLRRVDPKWLGYECFMSIHVPRHSPRRVIMGRGEEVIVAAGRQLLSFSIQGGLVHEHKIEAPARAVGWMDDERMLIALRDRIEVWESKGRRLREWPAFGGRSFLTGVMLMDGKVYVADSGNRVVYRCDLEGRVELRIGEKNPERGIPGLVLPSPFLDVEPGPDGLLWVNNPGRHHIEKFTPDGAPEMSWGRPGAGIESFCGCCNPVGFSVLPDGRCVTVEKGLPRVKVFSAGGKLESVVAGPDWFATASPEPGDGRARESSLEAWDVAVDRTGGIWVLDGSSETLHGFRRKQVQRGSA